MIKKQKNIILIVSIITLEILILINPQILIEYSKSSIELFTSKIFISLFPFFVLNKILIDYNLPYYISKLKINFFAKALNINTTSLPIILLSMISGMPSNAQYIKDYLDNNIITLEEAQKLLVITFSPSPVYCITVIGFLGFKSIITGTILLILVYLTNLLIGIFIRNKYKIKLNLNSIRTNNRKKFIISLKSAITSSFDSLMIILGNIIVFSLLIGLISKYFSSNIVLNSIIASFFELSNGIKKISDITTNFNIKFSLAFFALSFSGLSIHFQVSSILSKYNIDFFKIILCRLIISISFSSLIYLFLQILNHLKF